MPETTSADLTANVPETEVTLLVLPGTGGTVERDFAGVRLALDGVVPVEGYDYVSDAGATYDRMVDEVVRRITAQPERRFVLVGYSLSAAIAVGVAAALPRQVAGAVLIAGFSDGAEPRLVAQFTRWRELVAADRPAFAHLVLQTGHRDDIAASLTEDETAVRVADHLATADWVQTAAQIEVDLGVELVSRISRVSQPVLVIGCARDRIVPVELTRALAAELSTSLYDEVDAGHFVLVEQPDVVADRILRWIASTSFSA